MIAQANFAFRGRNPDVLTCIANLSNDEVFTPPEFANRMLDTLAGAWAANNKGATMWADKTVTFFDPCAKSGVFLREITRRLVQGLESEIPDRQQRVNHILTRQVFGIGITQLTAMLARRSVYCSKHAKGEHSIVKGFQSDDGNIWFQRIKHTWEGDKCRYCGAGKSVFDRAAGLETHACAFIPTATSRLGSPRFLEATCNSTSSLETRRISLMTVEATAQAPYRSIIVSSSKRSRSNQDFCQ